VEAGEHEVLGPRADLGHQRGGLRVGVERPLRARHVPEQPRIAIGAEAVAAALGGAMDDPHARRARGGDQLRDVPDHVDARDARGEVGQRGLLADHALLTLLGDERGVFRVDEAGEIERHGFLQDPNQLP